MGDEEEWGSSLQLSDRNLNKISSSDNCDNDVKIDISNRVKEVISEKIRARKCREIPAQRTRSPKEVDIAGQDFNKTLGLTQSEMLQEDLVTTILNRVKSRDISAQLKLKELKRFHWEKVDNEIYVRIRSNADLIFRAAETAMEEFQLNLGKTERQVLCGVLYIMNRSFSVPNQPPFSHRKIALGTFLGQWNLQQHCVVVSDPRRNSTSSSFCRLFNRAISSPTSQQDNTPDAEADQLIGECSFAQCDQQAINADFRRCLNLRLVCAESSLVKDVCANSQLVKLCRQIGPQEINVAKAMLAADKDEELLAIQHPSKSFSSSRKWTQVEVFRVFDTGHFLAYLGKDWKDIYHKLDKAMTVQRFKYKSTQEHIQSANWCKEGTVLLVKRTSVHFSTPPRLKFHVARAVAVETPDSCSNGVLARISCYFPDYGLVGSVCVADVTVGPRSLLSQPLLTFCQIQGVGPSPGLDLIQEAIRSCALLTNSENVMGLVAHTSLATVSTLTALININSESILESALHILKVIVENDNCLDLINLPERNCAQPASLQMLAPALLHPTQFNGRPFLRQQRLSLSYMILSTVRPDLMRSFMASHHTKLSQLNQNSCNEKEGILLAKINGLPSCTSHLGKSTNSSESASINRANKDSTSKKRLKNRGSCRALKVTSSLIKPSATFDSDINAGLQRRNKYEAINEEYSPQQSIVLDKKPVLARATDLLNSAEISDILGLDTEFDMEALKDRENDMTMAERIDLTGASEKLVSVCGVSNGNGTEEHATLTKRTGGLCSEEQEGESSQSQLTTDEDQKKIFVENKVCSVRQGTVLTRRLSINIETMENTGRTLYHAGPLAVAITALANTNGGTVYIGIKGKGLIRGLAWSRKEKDEFSQMLDKLTVQFIFPKFNLSNLSMDFIPVDSAHSHSDESERCLVRILVKSEEGKSYLTHNIPSCEPALYKRKRMGPNHTYKVSNEEAIAMMKSRKDFEAQHLLLPSLSG